MNTISALAVIKTASHLQPDVFQLSTTKVPMAIKEYLQGSTALILSHDTQQLFEILRKFAGNRESAPIIYELMKHILDDGEQLVTPDNYIHIVMLLNDFARQGSIGAKHEQKQDQAPRRGNSPNGTEMPHHSIIERACGAVDGIYSLQQYSARIIISSKLDRDAAWSAFWYPLFGSLSQQSCNPCRQVRHRSFNHLQRSLLSPLLTTVDNSEWSRIFDKVLLPLITQLLKPEVFQTDIRGMGETRVHAATLMCKTFLHYLSRLEDVLNLWMKILDIMDRFGRA